MEGAKRAVECGKKLHEVDEAVTDWRTALRYLKRGNERYAAGLPINRIVSVGTRARLSEGQRPFAAVLACSDSRVAPEIVFDQGQGDIFVIRNAGNIVDTAALGSIEYAVERLRTPLVVVVGHSGCGAVTGAFEGGGGYAENLQTVINKIRPAVTDSPALEDAIRANIECAVRRIAENETVIRAEAKVLGAYYDIATGRVRFLT